MERPGHFAGQCRYSAERDRARAGPVGGGEITSSRHRQHRRVTAEIAGEALGLPVAIDRDLREVAFGVQEGQAMSGWFADWVAGRFTPDGAETFPTLRRRAVAAINRATAQPPAVLVVAHGALFRALRAAMGIEPNVRTQNAVPIFCEPLSAGGNGWSLNPMI